MKIHGIALIILLIVTTATHAAPNYRGTSEALRIPGTPVVKVFDNYTVVGVGVPINPNFLPDQGAWQVVVNGAPTAWTVQIQGSLVDKDDGPWVEISEITESSLDRLRFWNSKPVPFHRAIITNKVGSGSFDLYMIKRGN